MKALRKFALALTFAGAVGAAYKAGVEYGTAQVDRARADKKVSDCKKLITWSHQCGKAGGAFRTAAQQNTVMMQINGGTALLLAFSSVGLVDSRKKRQKTATIRNK